nr:helix-turn-helix transcriptional regulator [Salipiger mucosus]
MPQPAEVQRRQSGQRSKTQPNPAELRGIFGANLRQLSQSAVSISALCRDLGINRTQFNRYLASESFPRPDILHRICAFFGVDARILLEPVEDLRNKPGSLLTHPYVADFLGPSLTELSEEDFPSGFYRFSRGSFTDETRFVVGLALVTRDGGRTFLRGLEPKESMAHLDMPANARNREYRGVVLPQAEGIAALVSRRESATTSFNYLSRVSTLSNHFFAGYSVRTAPEGITGRRATRMVFEHLGHDTGRVLAAARTSGFRAAEELVPFHRQQLRLDQPFA